MNKELVELFLKVGLIEDPIEVKMVEKLDKLSDQIRIAKNILQSRLEDDDMEGTELMVYSLQKLIDRKVDLESLREKYYESKGRICELNSKLSEEKDKLDCIKESIKDLI